MSWGEFATLLSGLNGFTPLGSVVSIRAEKDKDRIKKFSPEERKIYNDWKRKKINEGVPTTGDYKKDLAQLEKTLASMANVVIKGGDK